jgi:cell division protein FtsL
LSVPLKNEAFDYQKNAVTNPAWETAPKRTPGTGVAKPKIVEEPQKSAKQIKEEHISSLRKTVKLLLVSAVALFLVGTVIYSQSKLDDINRQINAYEQELTLAKSEYVRLDMKLRSLITLDKVEIYAREKMGMGKAESYQITYVDLSAFDKVILSGGKQTSPEQQPAKKNDETQNALERFLAYLH